jgi:hypothetical protein
VCELRHVTLPRVDLRSESSLNLGLVRRRSGGIVGIEVVQIIWPLVQYVLGTPPIEALARRDLRTTTEDPNFLRVISAT